MSDKKEVEGAAGNPSFEQGVVVGMIAMHEFRKAMKAGSGFRSDAFMKSLTSKYANKKVPLFPNGVPVEVMEYTDEVMLSLTLARTLD